LRMTVVGIIDVKVLYELTFSTEVLFGDYILRD
jgi:hypothetical protein